MSSLWRKLHFWFGLVVVVQFVLWLVSGMGFSLLWNEALTVGDRECRKLQPAPVPVADVLFSPSEIPSRVQGDFPSPFSIREIKLKTHGVTGRPIYVVRAIGGIDTPALLDTPVVFDASDGRRLPFLTEQEAVQIARAEFSGRAAVSGVEWITRPYQKGYDYYGDLPAWRINFDNWRGTRIYVSPYTGDILFRRNILKTFYDFFFTVHMFGYVDRIIYGNVGMIVFATLSLVAGVSGIWLYLPYLRKNGSKSNGDSSNNLQAAGVSRMTRP